MKKIQFNLGDCIGDLEIIEFLPNSKSGHSFAKALCKCQSIVKINLSSLNSRKHKKCRACIDKERRKPNRDKPEYSIYLSMKNRCINKNVNAYKNYGERGITICDSWLGKNGYENFYADMGERPSPKHSLDRIDNNLGYSKENCRWATPKEQANNRRSNKLITYQGKTQTLSNWGVELGILPLTLLSRLDKGWSIEKTLTTKLSESKVKHKLTFQNKTLTIKEWAELLNIKESLIYKRIKLDLPIAEVLKAPESFKSLTFKGETLTYSQWESKLNLPMGIIRKRIQAGWSVKDTLTKPSKKKKN
jgi:hypothetical protein